MRMYDRGFVAAILDGFENALDALIGAVDEDIRAELRELSDRIEKTRVRIDPPLGAEASGDAEPKEAFS